MLEGHSSQTHLDAKEHPVPGQPVDDWATLIGLEVEVYEGGRILDRGYVEAVAVDGRILWLSQSGAHTRRLWENAPGRQVKPAMATALSAGRDDAESEA